MLLNKSLTKGALALLGVALLASTASAAGSKRYAKLDDELNRRAAAAPPTERTSVVVRVKGAQLPAELKKFARSGASGSDGFILDVPNNQLKTVASNASTLSARHNPTVHAFNFRTGIQSGAFFARRLMGINGAGVGVAVLDSGVVPNNETPVAEFHDFLVPDADHAATELHCADNAPCDPNGHGTHVAGTIAGNGANSFGEKSGMAPGASLYALRVLGANGTGTVAGVVDALKWVLANHKAKNIRVVNLSFGMRPTGSLPDSDPLGTMLDPVNGDKLAIWTKALVDDGVFVVAAAGNVGQVACNTLETPPANPPANNQCDVWGGITEPGTFPWVFTAGANSSQGTFIREDDVRASFSSRGPAFPMQIAKPDILAGGVGIESTSAPGSTLYLEGAAADPSWLIAGSIPSANDSYMALTGTSQAAAVVSGVAAQMLQANPKLTPNFIKAILEYTSQDYAGYSPLEQGAGFLNALGAVRLSRFYATAKKGQRVPVEPIWSKHFIWGNHEMSGGIMLPKANAWQLGILWGVPKTAGDDGDNIVWGTACGSGDCGDNIVWGTSDGDNIVWGTADGDNIVWGTSGDGDNIVWGTSDDGDNIVWGTDCGAGGGDCGDNIVWGTAGDGDNIVWGTADDGDNIVWGTSGDGDNIVWGTSGDGDNIVWGTADGDNIVWGTSDGDNIVWGTNDGDNIVWGTAGDGDNIVWGTDGDNIVWGTDGDNIVWGTALIGHLPSTQMEWYQLFLNRRFDAWWVAHEFGDSFNSKDGGRPVVKPAKAMRLRKPPTSHRHK